jgi:methylated-DNA-[protein]-cysteine S-methyltransferase
MRLKKNDTLQAERKRIETPIGVLEIAADGGVVRSVRLVTAEAGEFIQENEKQTLLNTATRELKEYFEGKRDTFTFKMEPEGTPFQREIWNALLRIPFGETMTYGQIACATDRPNGARVVGMACNKNPIMIAIPCHRVVGADGSLTGYAAGTRVKQMLLDLERSAR